jgi:hypothetical protein
MYLLGAIVLLLIVLVAVVYARQPAPVASNPGEPAVAATSTAMPGVNSSAGAFDKATATKVPSGQDPKAFVSAYYKAILDKKYDVAFKMQPAASQQGGTVQDFQGTQQMYGMKSFKIKDSQVQGEEATVQVEQDLGTNGTWGATWTFVKDGNTWLVKERQVQMGVSQ